MVAQYTINKASRGRPSVKPVLHGSFDSGEDFLVMGIGVQKAIPKHLCKCIMAAKEIKSEIQRTLDNVPEDTLQDILNYLKSIQGKSSDNIKLGKNFRNSLTEDKTAT